MRCSRSARSIHLGKFPIHEAEHMPATLAARDILAQSSNIGTLQIALRSGPTRQRQFLGSMGLLKPMQDRIAGNRAAALSRR